MRCPRCGREGGADERYCTSCGADLATGAPPVSPPPQKPASYLVAGILITLCLCAPLGIATIVYAAQSDARWRAGDVDGAREASRKARSWAIAGGVLGGIVLLVYLAALAFAPETFAD